MKCTIVRYNLTGIPGDESVLLVDGTGDDRVAKAWYALCVEMGIVGEVREMEAKE